MLATIVNPEVAAKALERAKEWARLHPADPSVIAAADKAWALRREDEDANLKPGAPSRRTQSGEDWIPPEPPPEIDCPW